MKRIVAYCRESTVQQAQNGWNLDEQERQLRNYIEVYYAGEAYDLEVVREEGASAKTLNRPRFNEIMNRISKGELDILVVYTYDRLTRRLKDFIYLLEEMEKKGIVLNSIRDRFDTGTATGRMMAHIVVSLAEWEEDTIGERVARSLVEAAQQGNFPFGYTPLGYDKVKKGRGVTLAINEEEAEVVRWIFHELAYNDNTCYGISLQLRDNSVLNRSWSEKIVRTVATNRVYIGEITVKGTVFSESMPEIVDKKLFDRANMMMKKTKHYKKNSYLFKGMVYCKNCNTVMRVTCTTKHPSNTVYLYYQCGNCRFAISDKKLRKMIGNEVITHYKNDSFDDVLVKLQKKHGDNGSLIKRLNYQFMVGNIKSETYTEIKSKLDQVDISICKSIEKSFRRLRIMGINTSSLSDVRRYLLKKVDKIVCDKHSCVVYWHSYSPKIKDAGIQEIKEKIHK